jgi:hypothetical protein
MLGSYFSALHSGDAVCHKDNIRKIRILYFHESLAMEFVMKDEVGD